MMKTKWIKAKKIWKFISSQQATLWITEYISKENLCGDSLCIHNQKSILIWLLAAMIVIYVILVEFASMTPEWIKNENAIH